MLTDSVDQWVADVDINNLGVLWLHVGSELI